MKTISIRELYLLMRTRVKRERPVARPEAIAEHGRENRFLTRTLRPGYKGLMGTLTGGTDSVTIVSEGRDGR